jgi:hypothetical protein
MNPVEIEASVAPLLKEADRLEKEAKSLRALANEVEQKLASITGNGRKVSAVTNHLTLQDFLNAVGEKSGRVKDFAVRLGTTENQIRKFIEQADGRVTHDWRGWLKLEVSQVAA